MDDPAGLTVEVDAGVATVTFDLPPVNLFTVGLFRATAEAVERLAADDEVRAVVLRSANPDFFIAHFDVAAILRMPADQPPASELNAFHRMCETLRTMPKPTIAVIEGRVGGGGSELALSCDIRFAALPDGDHPGARFNQPEVALGIIPGGSGTVRLPRLIGRGRALEVILGCDDIDAATAEAWGWVNRALPPAELWPFVERLVARLVSFPPHAVAAAKASVVDAEGDVESHLLREGDAFNGTLGDPVTQRRLERFLAEGGQTSDGALELGDLLDRLADQG